MVKEIRERLTQECFNGSATRVIATGGFSSLFEKANLFDQIVPDLVLRGLNYALKMNV